jgi:hypothetical protein
LIVENDGPSGPFSLTGRLPADAVAPPAASLSPAVAQLRANLPGFAAGRHDEWQLARPSGSGPPPGCQGDRGAVFLRFSPARS